MSETSSSIENHPPPQPPPPESPPESPESPEPPESPAELEVTPAIEGAELSASESAASSSEAPDTSQNSEAPDNEVAAVAESTESEAEQTAIAPPVDMAELQGRVEAILMSVDRPMPTGKLQEAVGATAKKSIVDAVDALNIFYETHQRSFRIEEVADGFRLYTRPEFGSVVHAVHRTRQDNRLSAAALETLAIIAYKQPIMRVQLEAIRGVSCGEVVRSLMEKRLVKIVGRAEELGRPMLYGTTKQFLEVFGMAHLRDLPNVEELNRP